MRTRIVLLVVALVMGGAAAFMTARYLTGIRTEVSAQAKPVDVLVATQDIPRGISSADLFERGIVKMQKVPQRFVAAGAISSKRVIEGQVLSASLSAGEQLTRARFEYPGDAGLSYTVPAGYVAVAIEVDEVKGISGLLKPADSVGIFATLQPDPTKKNLVTKLLVPTAKVLAVGMSVGGEEEDAEAEGGSGGALSGRSASKEAPKSATLALSAVDAARVVLAEESGTIRLVLLPPDLAEMPKVASQTVASVLR